MLDNSIGIIAQNILILILSSNKCAIYNNRKNNNTNRYYACSKHTLASGKTNTDNQPSFLHQMDEKITLVNVLKFRTLVACQNSLDNQSRIRSDCF